MLDTDIAKMKVSELREALKAKGLNTTGNKQELVERLSAALLDGSHIDSKFEDELLNDDDLDNEEKSVLESTKDLLQSPDTSKSSTPDTPTPATKVILKRNIVTVHPLLEQKTPEPEEKKEDEDVCEPEKKVIKISNMTAQDRLEMRAKKFGASAANVSSNTASSQGKLEARAARFGITSSTTTAATPGNNENSASAELLKKRAERFGAISNVAKKSEYEDKLQKRKERFGDSAISSSTASGKVAITGPSPTSDSKVDYAEKARLRLERFKQTA